MGLNNCCWKRFRGWVSLRKISLEGLVGVQGQVKPESLDTTTPPTNFSSNCPFEIRFEPASLYLFAVETDLKTIRNRASRPQKVGDPD